MSFIYDRNALWNKYLPSNFKIIVLNNQAGGIFGLIDGPANLPELEEYFETVQPLNAESTAKEHLLPYYRVKSTVELLSALPAFLKESKTSILEIFTDKKINREVFKGLREKI
jgi:2-succinyl-5-enolpyruvyl-6-hydroxy-3-cyclohexene-1-carboxylate synthase